VPARLTLYPTDQPTRQFSLDPECRHLVGRGSDCDLRVDDPRLSRRHAWLAVAEGCWRFGDLDSKNGTTRAGRTADDAALRDGDWISFGGLLGQFADLRSAGRASAGKTRSIAAAASIRRRTSTSCFSKCWAHRWSSPARSAAT
jgi:pSer/pThr/pTyr-binding forkhead associated (FHA) protein